jgi:CubicO group peptidase (beta-lactamase class C family)
MKRFQIALLALFTVLVMPGSADASDDLAADMQRILESAFPADRPGATALVVDDGKVIFRGASGMANLELGVPLDPAMVLRIGSITKQFTAVAILMLEEEGLLSVEDPITRFLPDYPTHGHEITIHQLLNHTSGIRSYTDDVDEETFGRLDLSTTGLVDSFKDLNMDFAPGEKWKYNNSGYVLLGAIIEAISGQSYADFVQGRIFDPLGMADSHYGGHQLIEGRVSGYDWDGEVFANTQYLSMTIPHAGGSLLSSVDDMARWNNGLFGGKLLSEGSLQKMTTKTLLNDGSDFDYGYGLGVSEFRGTRRISHGGGIHGFLSQGVYLPEEGIYAIVLSNWIGPNNPMSRVAGRMAAAALGKPLPEFEPVEVSPSVLEGYEGVYRVDDETSHVVRFEEGRLITEAPSGRPRMAVPHSSTGFFYENSLDYFEMTKGDDGTLEMHLYSGGDLEPEIAVLSEEALSETASGRRPKVLLIGVDGIRVDILQAAETPNFDALAADGELSLAARIRPNTVSGPGWSSMLTGVWMDKHGVENNDFSSSRYEDYPDFLTRIESVRPELSTLAILDWPPLGTTQDGGPLVGSQVDLVLNVNGDSIGYGPADELSTELAVERLRDGDPDATFIYLGDTDVVAHDTSSLSDEYRAAIETADRQIGMLVEAVRARPTYDEEDWLILSSSDHGRTDDGGHGGESEEELIIYYLVSGASTTALSGPGEVVDVACTALAHLGIEIEADWNLDCSVNGLTP